MTENYNNKILQGNVLEVLRSLPDNFVDMMITSPPYWALRDYGLPDSIFGGDFNCNHNWQEHVKHPIGGKGSKCANVGANKNDFANMRDHDVISNTCSLCGSWKGQLGQEPNYHDYINHLFEIMQEVARVVKDSGSIWVNLGDSYAGTGDKGNLKDPKYPDGRNGQSVAKNRIVDGVKQKSLVGIPDRFKIKMIDGGFICRNEIVWHKPNQMPSSVKDRFTVDFEKFYFFTQNTKYYFEQQFDPYTEPMNRWAGDKLVAKGESDWDDGTGQSTYRDRNMRPNPNGKNKRCVWSINTKPLKEAHFAIYPEKLIETPILACCPENGLVMDIFFGSGTTGVVAKKLNKNYLGIELNPEYIKIAEKRLGIV
jgi:site-specific DNA-methyltransferase (adenine-specific)